MGSSQVNPTVQWSTKSVNQSPSTQNHSDRGVYTHFETKGEALLAGWGLDSRYRARKGEASLVWERAYGGKNVILCPRFLSRSHKMSEIVDEKSPKNAKK